jgi:hypothetical protein
MQNLSPNNEPSSAPVDLGKIIKLIFNEKLLVLTITLSISIITLFYVKEIAPEYQSNATVEVGQITTNTSPYIKTNVEYIGGIIRLIEPTKVLINELIINFAVKRGVNIDFSTKMGRLLNIKVNSHSEIESNEIMNEVIDYISIRHKKITLDRIKNLNEEIKGVNNYLSNYANSIENEIEIISKEVEFLSKNENIEIKNLMNNFQDFSNNSSTSETERIALSTRIFSRIVRKELLEKKLIDFKSSLILSEKFMDLGEISVPHSQEQRMITYKNKLEVRLNELTETSLTPTALIGKITTQQLKTNKVAYLLISLVFGFVLSIFTILIKSIYRRS